MHWKEDLLDHRSPAGAGAAVAADNRGIKLSADAFAAHDKIIIGNNLKGLSNFVIRSGTGSNNSLHHQDESESEI